MLPVSTENYVGGVWGEISKAGVCACVDVERGSERKQEKTQMGLIFNSALVGLSFIYKWIYIYNLADITVSVYGARQSVRAHTNMYLLRLM